MPEALCTSRRQGRSELRIKTRFGETESSGADASRYAVRGAQESWAILKKEAAPTKWVPVFRRRDCTPVKIIVAVATVTLIITVLILLRT